MHNANVTPDAVIRELDERTTAALLEIMPFPYNTLSEFVADVICECGNVTVAEIVSHLHQEISNAQ